MEVSIAGEGPMDIAIMRSLLLEVGLTPGVVFFGEGRNNGKHKLDEKIAGYAVSARNRPWFITRDLDNDNDCTLHLRNQLVDDIPDLLCFRIAVRQIESWLIADRMRLAQHLGVATTRLPADPEKIDDTKGAIVAAARRSRKRIVRNDVPPREGSGRKVGIGYNEVLEAFVQNIWKPREAMEKSDSLANTIRRLERLRTTLES